MNFKKFDIKQLLTAVGIFFVVEFLLFIAAICIFRKDLVTEFFATLAPFVIFLLVGILVFVLGYLACLIPAKRFFSLMKNKQAKLVENAKQKKYYENAYNTLLEENKALKAKFNAAGIMVEIKPLQDTDSEES